MKLFFQRTENDEQIVIRYTSTWLYLLLIGVLVLGLLSAVRMPFNPEPLKHLIFAAYVLLFVFYYVVTISTRREIFRAIKERNLVITGSRFNPRNPLVVTINKSYPAPSVK